MVKPSCLALPKCSPFLFRDFTTRSLFLSYAKKPTFVGHDDPRVNPTSTEMTTDS